MMPDSAENGDPIRDAVLLLGGSGSRLGRLTTSLNKHLLPVYDRTLAENALSWLVGLGCRRIAIVAAPRDVPTLFPHLERSGGVDTQLVFVLQPHPTGTGDAVHRALRALQAQQVLVLFGDNVFIGEFERTQIRELAPEMDVRCYLRWTEQRLDQFSVVLLEGSRATLATRPHSHTAGYPVTGLFAIRGDAALEYHRACPRADTAAGREYDVMEFVASALRNQRAEMARLTVAWHDAGYSYEALWEAGRSIRCAVRQARSDLSAGSGGGEGGFPG
jgi:glucose-1-phosphate thymidylyltransferase